MHVMFQDIFIQFQKQRLSTIYFQAYEMLLYVCLRFSLLFSYYLSKIVNKKIGVLCFFGAGRGISAYAGQRGAAGRSLEACLKQATRDIPPERHHRTPVYLGATAGMRLLKLVCFFFLCCYMMF